jgi:hypothetical protein
MVREAAVEFGLTPDALNPHPRVEKSYSGSRITQWKNGEIVEQVEKGRKARQVREDRQEVPL